MSVRVSKIQLNFLIFLVMVSKGGNTMVLCQLVKACHLIYTAVSKNLIAIIDYWTRDIITTFEDNVSYTIT